MTNSQVINYYNNRTQEKLTLTESFVDYGTKYDSTKNFITKKQTTSLLNTPYFINALMEGVENQKNNIENPYTSLGYLYLNSLPISTLREKFKSFGTGQTTEENYIFATLNKFSSIHKLPYLFILKYGSIWHRYKRYQRDNVDIIDNIWKDFDYINAYDPINGTTTKQYTFTDYGGEEQTIRQYNEYSEQVNVNPIDAGGQTGVTKTIQNTIVQNGFFPKVINDVYYFFTNKDLFTSYNSSEIQSAQENKKLKIGSSPSTRIKLNTAEDEIYQMNTWSQFLNIKGNHEFREFENDKALVIPSFGQSKFNQSRFECFNESGSHTQNVTTNKSIYNGGVKDFGHVKLWILLK